jgi:hypothetical protein
VDLLVSVALVHGQLLLVELFENVKLVSPLQRQRFSMIQHTINMPEILLHVFQMPALGLVQISLTPFFFLRANPSDNPYVLSADR